MPQTRRAGYDILSGKERNVNGVTAFTPYENYGAARAAGAGAGVGAGAGARRSQSRHERVSSGGSVLPPTGPMSTRPW